MNIYLSDNSKDQIPGDLIPRAVLRSDLVPVPRTLEFSVKLKDELGERLKEGQSVWAGHENLEYRIIKTDAPKSLAQIQGRDQNSVVSVSCLLASCAGIAFRRDRAVIAKNEKIGALYRSCGASITIGNDVPVDRFACLKGQVPSFHLALAMQEECVCLVLRDGQLNLIRLQDLFNQKPKDNIGKFDSTDTIESEFMLRHEVPSFYSIDENGEFIFGSTEDTRAISFVPRATVRQLRNMTRVLVVRKKLVSNYAANINAGDLLTIMDKNYVVITAAHAFEDAGGVKQANSYFWVGDLSQ